MISSAATTTGNGAVTAGREAVPYDPKQFDWPLAYDAEKFLHQRVATFLEQNSFARCLSDRMLKETGTDFFEWIDHLVLSPEDEKPLREVGFTRDEEAETPNGEVVLHHPRATLPRVILRA